MFKIAGKIFPALEQKKRRKEKRRKNLAPINTPPTGNGVFFQGVDEFFDNRPAKGSKKIHEKICGGLYTKKRRKEKRRENLTP